MQQCGRGEKKNMHKKIASSEQNRDTRESGRERELTLEQYLACTRRGNRLFYISSRRVLRACACREVDGDPYKKSRKMGGENASASSLSLYEGLKHSLMRKYWRRLFDILLIFRLLDTVHSPAFPR